MLIAQSTSQVELLKKGFFLKYLMFPIPGVKDANVSRGDESFLKIHNS